MTIPTQKFKLFIVSYNFFKLIAYFLQNMIWKSFS